MDQTDDVRIKRLRPLIPPVILLEELPIGPAEAAFVRERRLAIGEVIAGRDTRLLVVVGPCSIHDPEAALEYAGQLRGAAERYSSELMIVMRTYFEKPRTTVGWKGLINDPHLDGTVHATRRTPEQGTSISTARPRDRVPDLGARCAAMAGTVPLSRLPKRLEYREQAHGK